MRDWQRIRQGVPVLPAPDPVALSDEESVGLFIVNRDLSVEHLVQVPAAPTVGPCITMFSPS